MKIKKEEWGSSSGAARSAPGKISESYLHNAGLSYLQRFAASSEHFREVMLRKVRRSCAYHKDQNFETCARMVDDLVMKFQEVGLLDDRTYARAVVTSLRRRGKSRRAIFSYLAAKGIARSIAEKQLQVVDMEDGDDDSVAAELKAAVKFAQKKKFGPYGGGNHDRIEKEMATMARGGFSYDVIRAVLRRDKDDVQGYL